METVISAVCILADRQQFCWHCENPLNTPTHPTRPLTPPRTLKMKMPLRGRGCRTLSKCNYTREIHVPSTTSLLLLLPRFFNLNFAACVAACGSGSFDWQYNNNNGGQLACRVPEQFACAPKSIHLQRLYKVYILREIYTYINKYIEYIYFI